MGQTDRDTDRAHRAMTAGGAAKAGTDGLRRTAAIEVAPFGLTVDAVAAGSIATEGQTLPEIPG